MQKNSALTTYIRTVITGVVYFQPFYLVELDPQMDWGNASQIKEKLGQSGWKDYALMYSDYMAWLVH